MRINAKEANLIIDQEKCTRCGLCTHICWTHAMVKGPDGIPVMSQTDPSDTWHSCWACQRCLAVCPTGALQICGKKPEDSVAASAMPSPESVDALMLNRRTCRDYKDENIPLAEIEHLLKIVGNAPSAGCNQEVQFSVIADKDVLKRFSTHFWERICENASKGIYPDGFSEKDFLLVKKGMDHGKDVVFRGAPHLLLIHTPAGKEGRTVDAAIAMTYAELLFNSHGYGTVVASFAWAALKTLPDVREELGIPADHFLQCPLLFGVPSITFPRGVQRFDHLKIHVVS
jgi:nitroreductase/NAD-dependent dihydropyrimidine dehydrogenase PreA subunit